MVDQVKGLLEVDTKGQRCRVILSCSFLYCVYVGENNYKARAIQPLAIQPVDLSWLCTASKASALAVAWPTCGAALYPIGRRSIRKMLAPPSLFIPVSLETGKKILLSWMDGAHGLGYLHSQVHVVTVAEETQGLSDWCQVPLLTRPKRLCRGGFAV